MAYQPMKKIMVNLRALDTSPDTMTALANAFTDITGAEVVEVQIDFKRDVVHINVNGICVLRICRIKQIEERILGHVK